MKCKKIVIPILAVLVALSAVGCAAKGKESKAAALEKKEITVFAAASLTESFTEMAKNFEKQKNIKIKFNFAGSQDLASSIKAGAGADIFASANKKYMDDLTKENLISKSNTFTKNTLVVCKSKKSSKDIKDLKDLDKDGVKIIVGDKSVPCGSYFYTALDSAVKGGMLKAEEKDKILKNVKSQELNVKDIVAKVQLGDGDVGIVYKSDITEANKKDLDMIKIDEFSKLNVEYPIGIIKSSKNSSEAETFVDYVNSQEGKTILDKYGFDTGK
ncbi:molybdate ABC transporter substrate-binding protein [Clostridium manihotivorum]|uniref:Molybdate-binding protein ModA n=1 Tax=Clostridium manihotivorum TaxID=2320868 RepID=A0A3R5QVX7_9CLOT|nr:molybdate ABC transporter substrate-binding protein [Clostridium manihotivorum]QAA33624.1 molybdate ABC transporter substrate-binding protein [Clostridium manihotivorum]